MYALESIVQFGAVPLESFPERICFSFFRIIKSNIDLEEPHFVWNNMSVLGVFKLSNLLQVCFELDNRNACPFDRFDIAKVRSLFKMLSESSNVFDYIFPIVNFQPCND